MAVVHPADRREPPVRRRRSSPRSLLRVAAELGYRWQSWFNDSFTYVRAAVTLTPNTTRPSGYPLYLWLLSPAHSYLLVTASQHLMGLLVAVMIYALARHRFARARLGRRRWPRCRCSTTGSRSSLST